MNNRSSFTRFLLVVFTLVAFIAPNPINAIFPEGGSHPCPDGSAPYIAARGDSLWKKAGGPDYESGLTRLKEQNPSLKKRELIRYSPDRVFFLLKEGEPICGLAGTGLEIRNRGELVKSSEESTVPITTATPPPSNPAQGTGKKKVQEADAGSGNNLTIGGITMPWWAWLTFGILLGFLLASLFNYHKKRTLQQAENAQREREARAREGEEARRHPATLGPPMVPGGIAHLDPADVGNLMDKRVQAQIGSSARRIAGPNQVRLMGRWGFDYGDNVEREGICSGREEDRAYRSVYKRPNGRTFERFTLIWCGNDARTAQSLGGTWVFDPLPAREPAPITTPAPRATFGIKEAQEFDSITPRTNRDRREYVMMLRHLDVTITLPDEVGHVQRSCESAYREFGASEAWCNSEIERLYVEIKRLRQQAIESATNADTQRRIAEKHQQLLESFIPPTPAATIIQTRMSLAEPQTSGANLAQAELDNSDVG